MIVLKKLISLCRMKKYVCKFWYVNKVGMYGTKVTLQMYLIYVLSYLLVFTKFHNKSVIFRVKLRSDVR